MMHVAVAIEDLISDCELILERLSREEFGAHITIPIAPLLSFHNRALLFSFTSLSIADILGRSTLVKAGCPVKGLPRILSRQANCAGILPWLWLSNYCGRFVAGVLGCAELLMKSVQLGMTSLVLPDPGPVEGSTSSCGLCNEPWSPFDSKSGPRPWPRSGSRLHQVNRSKSTLARRSCQSPVNP